MNSCIKYPGSKWSIAEWIISFFPEHHSYVEPFFGSGAVLFNKPRSNIETINDLDGDVVNFFDWCRKDPERLAYEIHMTPYSREVYERTKTDKPESSFDRALRFCIETNMSHGFKVNERSGWKIDVQGRERAYAANYWTTMPEKILQTAERLRGVQIERRNAIDLIKAFNHANVLIYCDPPYPMEARRMKMYKCEMDETDHQQLLLALKAHKGPAIISSYSNRLYNTMLKDWHREEIKTYNQLAQERKEVLYMNFEPGGHQVGLDEI